MTCWRFVIYQFLFVQDPLVTLCLEVTVLSPLRFWWFLKRLFSQLYWLFYFHFKNFVFSLVNSWIFYLIILTWYNLSQSFAKNDGLWYSENSLNISQFMFSFSFLISSANFSFDLNIITSNLGILLCALVFLGVWNTDCSGIRFFCILNLKIFQQYWLFHLCFHF